MAIEEHLQQLGEITVVAPLQQCSGVSHSITYRRPLTCEAEQRPTGGPGWGVDGMPADCVKLGINELCENRPDLVVSGINAGFNAGINIIYSGTVAAAREAFFYGISSIAVSLESDEEMNYDGAAAIALPIISKILAQQQGAGFYNINIPSSATREPWELRVLPMSLACNGDGYIQREDPNRRPYYWTTDCASPPRASLTTDMDLLLEGFVTITPLLFDATDCQLLEQMQDWEWS